MKNKKDRHGRSHDPSGRFDLDPNARSHAYENARLRLLQEQTRIVSLQRRDLQGRLIPRAEVEESRRAEHRFIRRRLMQVPDAVLARLPGIKTPAEAERLMREEIYAALVALSQTQVVVRKRRATGHGSI